MSELPRGLDHLVIAVPDLHEAMIRYAAFGFTTTPRAMHPWGTGNSLVQFQRNFLELLSVEHPQQIPPAVQGEFNFGDFNRRFLAHGAGLSMLVFSSTDVDADIARWQARGLDTYPRFDFSRTATLPDGAQVQVAFSLGFVTHPDMPWAAWFVCQQHFPEHFWKPHYQQHGNGARRLRTVMMAAREPDRYRDFLAALFPQGEVQSDDGGIALHLPEGNLLVHTPSRLQDLVPDLDHAVADQGPRFVAAEVEVEDLTGMQHRLQGGSIPYRHTGNRVWVPASANEGLALAFRTAR